MPSKEKNIVFPISDDLDIIPSFMYFMTFKMDVAMFQISNISRIIAVKKLIILQYHQLAAILVSRQWACDINHIKLFMI